MLGKLGILGIAAILACATGCTMCCHPYDNCGPVYDDSCGQPYCSSARAGSILEKGDAVAASEEVLEENAASVSSATEYEATAESEPRMLSVADRNAGETAGISAAQPARRTNKSTSTSTSTTARRR
jgi:hypothetical protein